MVCALSLASPLQMMYNTQSYLCKYFIEILVQSTKSVQGT